VLLAELTIEPTRPTAFSYGAVLFWFFAWFVGFISPYLQVNNTVLPELDQQISLKTPGLTPYEICGQSTHSST